MKKYRKEIDGLRAIAVIPVILFHTGFQIFAGGFIGVDIFFVISGYLITLIINKEIENKKFNLFVFYERRIRRILPALIFMLAVTYIISYFIFLPGAHKTIGQFVITSIFSISNLFLYLRGNNYFGLEDGNNPLYHTWSLGVEEQFYFFFPIFLLLANIIFKNKLFLPVTFITLLSFYVSEVVQKDDIIANFYFPHTRGWELLIGSITALIVNKIGSKKNEIISLIGLTAILLSIFIFDKTFPFPSIYTLVPILGVVLILIYGNEDTIVAKLLSNKYLVGIGLISYSIYLWHLPLYTFLKYFFEINNLNLIIYFFLLITVSYFSYKLIEIPFRFKFKRRNFLIYVSISSLILTIVAIFGHLNGGYPERKEIFSKLQHNHGFGIFCNGNATVSTKCSESSNPEIAILGNSYAMFWVNSIKEKYDKKIVQLTQDSCALGFVDIVKDINEMTCKDFYIQSINTISKTNSISKVILSSNFNKEIDNGLFIESFKKLLFKLNNKNIIVIGPTPKAPFNVGECLAKKELFFSDSNCDFLLSPNHKSKIMKISKILENIENVKFVDITDIICPNNYCAMKPNNNVLLYVDNGHLSNLRALYVIDQLNLRF